MKSFQGLYEETRANSTKVKEVFDQFQNWLVNLEGGNGFNLGYDPTIDNLTLCNGYYKVLSDCDYFEDLYDIIDIPSIWLDNFYAGNISILEEDVLLKLHEFRDEEHLAYIERVKKQCKELGLL